MNHLKVPGSLGRLVGLEMSHQMPRRPPIAERLDLCDRFLNAVLAELGLTGIERGANDVGGNGLGNGDETNRGGIAAGPDGGVRDATADVVQPGAKRGGVGHRRYFSESSAAFAMLAFFPCGSSFRYVWNAAMAALLLPSHTSTRPSM
jgi:hypothetical protein